MRGLLRHYQFPLMLFFFRICSHSTPSPSSVTKSHICSYSESAALLQFKHAFVINGSASDLSCDASYPKTDSWKEDTDCCSWEGVSCSSLTGHVIGLDLSCSQLDGDFPPNSSLFQLKNLKSLNLAFNNFRHSRISAEFGQFTNLTHLDLSSSLFSGQVPSELPKSNWTSALEFLSLGSNLVSGQLPDSIGELKSLKILDLTGCKLIGTIPTSIGNLSNICLLNLSGNHLTGQIPPSIANLTQLQLLDISGNQLVGPIPDQASNLSKLMVLSLSDNLLNGTIPSWVFNVPSLQALSLNDNRLTGHINDFKSISLSAIFLQGNMLHGQIPDSIFELVNLTSLDLSSNNFSGIVELHKFSKFKSLELLGLSNNSLSLNTDNIFNSTLPKLKLLYLSSCNLSDFPNFLRASNNLEVLDLSKNRISGPIPKWMWNIGKDTLSRLSLSYNLLTGPIEFPWQNIGFLELQYNHFEGLLPIPSIGTIFFSISNNNLRGEVSSLFCNLNSLEILDLSHNNLSENIPDCLFNYSKTLSVVDLQFNNFHGAIPSSFIKGCALTMLNLHSNQFHGSMPPSVANCRSLEVLDVGSNYMKDAFPRWVDSLPDLQVLCLRSNKFHGFVNNSKESTRQPFPKLRVLDLSSNDFGGSLSPWYLENMKVLTNVNPGVLQYMRASRRPYDYSIVLNIKGNIVQMEKVLTMFTSLDLSKNNFEGVIPEVVGKLRSLKGLNLSHNNLGGHIPQSIGNLTNLEWLDLSSNKLMGMIPGELPDLISLAVLNLSNNQLVGPIPEGKQFSTFENSSYEENSGLCGFPLSKLCDETEKQKTPTSSSESESGLDFGWKVVLMGYGCGLIFGAVGGYLVLITGKPKWIVNLVDGKRKWRRKE